MLFSILMMSLVLFAQLTSAAPSTNSGEPKEYVSESSFPSSFENIGSSRNKDVHSNKKKITRQIFDDEDENRDSDLDHYQEQERPRAKVRVSNTEGSSRPKEEFNGFPDDFTKGLKPFDFESTSGSHRNSKSSGFVDFSIKDHQLPSLASSLGGLIPFPPLSSAATGSSSSQGDGLSSSDARSSKHSRPTKKDYITPNSFLSGDEAPIYFSEDGDVNNNNNNDDHGKEFTSRTPKETSAASFENEDARERFPSDGGRDYKEEEFNEPNPVELDDRSTENDNSPSNSEEFNNPDDDRNNYESSSERRPAERQPYSTEESFEQEQPPSSSSSSSFSRPSKNRNNNKNSFSSTEVLEEQRSSNRPSSSSKNPTDNFRDLNQYQQSESQNFVPIAQLHNRPVAFPLFQRFRPLEAAAPNPTIRNFRQVSQQPQFFLTPGQFPRENINSGFFGGGGGGAAVGVQGGFNQVPASNFESSHKFSQPEFRFHLDQQQQQQRHRLPQHVAPHQQLHSDDMTNHHSSATNNILGSGNFGILRGGIFADADNPHDQPYGSFHGLHHGGHGGEDFFHGFRDFQPFGGPLNNALSNKSQNIHRSPSKKEEVTVRPSSRSSNTTSIEDSTVLDTESGQLMQEK